MISLQSFTQFLHLSQMNERDMQDQITIRMTKTIHQDQPPYYYSIQGSVLIQHLIAGLIEFGNNAIKDEWNQQSAPYIVASRYAHLKNDCDAVVEIIEEPPLTILWTWRALDTDLTIIPGHNQRPRLKPKYAALREHDKPP
jgi:hypothetical protein